MGARLSGKHVKKKGGNGFPAFFNLAGIIIFLLVIGSYLPLTLPPLWGLEVYAVTSGSMAPEIPEGSAVYLRETIAEDLQPGTVIGYAQRENVVVHRVVENNRLEGRLVTKGDANTENDPEKITYEQVRGEKAFHIPFLGALMGIYSGTAGKIYLMIFLLCGVMLQILARIFAKEES